MAQSSQPALRVVEGSSAMDKSKALDAALSQIERNFGKGSIMRLGKSDKNLDVDTVSTGSLGLAIAPRIRGLPGRRGRRMSEALARLPAWINRSNTMVIFINQIRMKIGVMYGSPETTTGGHALKFYASVRLDIRRIGAIKDREEVVGNQTRVKVVKNKLAPPFKQVEFDIMYGSGVSKTGELVDLGVKAGVVEKSGSWFSYDSQRIGQGRENAKAFLKANPDIANRIEAAVRQNSGLIAEKILAGEEEAHDTDEGEG